MYMARETHTDKTRQDRQPEMIQRQTAQKKIIQIHQLHRACPTVAVRQEQMGAGGDVKEE